VETLSLESPARKEEAELAEMERPLSIPAREDAAVAIAIGFCLQFTHARIEVGAPSSLGVVEVAADKEGLMAEDGGDKKTPGPAPRPPPEDPGSSADFVVKTCMKCRRPSSALGAPRLRGSACCPAALDSAARPAEYEN
jgi:hypothetical protein